MEQTSVSVRREMGSKGDAYAHLEGLRWNGQPQCPHCAAARPLPHACEWREPQDTHRSSFGAPSVEVRRVPKAVFGLDWHGSPRNQVPVLTWLSVISAACGAERGVSARQIEENCHVNPSTAVFMLRRVVAAASNDPPPRPAQRWPSSRERDEIVVVSDSQENALRSLVAPS